MIQKKICMLGAFAVGKTSLVQRFVQSIFSEKYHSTIGVKVDKKCTSVDGQDINLILWDIHGEETFKKIQTSYLRGSSGYLLVVDGTRLETLDIAMKIRERVEMEIGVLPFVLVLNKCDLTDAWAISAEVEMELEQQGIVLFKSSAKSGQNVEAAFQFLAEKVMEKVVV